MRKSIFFIILTLFSLQLISQVNLNYQKPSPEILELVDYEPAPIVRSNSDNSVLIFLYRDAYKSLEELSAEEVRLAGLRINPKTNIGSRTNYYNNIKIKNLSKSNETEVEQVANLPKGGRIANIKWSPDENKIAFTNTIADKVELWILDIENASAKQVSTLAINANLGDVINWFEDSNSVLVKVLPSNPKNLVDAAASVPSGPTISVADGKKAQNRTYQDLLKNPIDEQNFEALAYSELHKVNLDGTSSLWMKEDMYRGISFSPDGEYVMVSIVEKPFSYLVPYYRFPSKSTVYSKTAQEVKVAIQVPLIEDLPKGFMSCRKGPRNFSWRTDKAASLVFAEALDGGDPANEVEFRDEVFQWDAPFDSPAKSLLKTNNRYRYIEWANDDVAIAHDYWWNTRNTKSYIFNPSDNTQKTKVIIDRNYQDRYSDPGYFMDTRNKYGSKVLITKNDQFVLVGDGFTEKGQFPFIDYMDIKTGDKKRVYESSYTDKYEDIYEVDVEKQTALVRIESKNEYPNFFTRDLKDGKLSQMTFFKNPFESINNVHKEVINYKREDGLDLTGTMYLPKGFDKNTKAKAPMILWAYPREFKDKSSAGQNTKNPNRFTFPFWGSPIYWVTKGYVVLDGASFPIVGEGEDQPNDSFRSQLVANAKAAIDAVDNLGYIDRSKVAVGGHSYGAFMVANLLSHSDLFAAGIARSGAYNRTLTPFGFQSEERNYWEAPEVYYNMSPFMHADKMKTPLLLIHGEADNNSGTYPLQSERYFNALKGLGAIVRLVMLPKESHGYRAKESILHLLWEQDQWLEKYVKNKEEVTVKK